MRLHEQKDVGIDEAASANATTGSMDPPDPPPPLLLLLEVVFVLTRVSTSLKKCMMGQQLAQPAPHCLACVRCNATVPLTGSVQGSSEPDRSLLHLLKYPPAHIQLSMQHPSRQNE